MTRTFGELVAEGMAEKGLSDYKLSAAIGLLPGNRVFGNVQIRRIRTGERQHLTRELVERLIDVLGLDWAEGWAAAGLLPPGLTADHLRQLDLVATGANVVSRGTVRTLPVERGLGDLVRRLRPQPELAVAA